MPPAARVLEPPPVQTLPAWAGILPWLAYALGLQLLPLAAPALALATALLLAWRARTALNALDAGILVYFLLLTGLVFSAAGRNLSPQTHFAICPAVLAVAAAASVALRRPFTFAYAYPYAPKNIRDQPAFFFANQCISLLWMTGFAAAALIILLVPGEWSLSRGAVILAASLAAAAGASVLVGGWFHFRLSRTFPKLAPPRGIEPRFAFWLLVNVCLRARNDILRY